MKKIRRVLALLICALALSCASGSSAEKSGSAPEKSDALRVDAALNDFSGYAAGRLPQSSLTAVAVLDTPLQRLGNYIADELITRLVNDGGLRVISRQDFERILAEQNVQAAMNFDDDSTAKIGHNLGWTTIIFGAIDPLETGYRLSLRAVDVNTGELRGMKSYILENDPVLVNLVNPNMTVQRLTERDSLLQPFDGKRNDFELQVKPSKTVYYDNEELTITLRASEDCYFVVYQIDIDNNMQVIYPNFWDSGNNILKAGVTRSIPEDTSFVLHAPYGEERILVYASPRPFTIPEDQYSPRPITREYLASPQALWRIESASGSGSKDTLKNTKE